MYTSQKLKTIAAIALATLLMFTTSSLASVIPMCFAEDFDYGGSLGDLEDPERLLEGDGFDQRMPFMNVINGVSGVEIATVKNNVYAQLPSDRYTQYSSNDDNSMLFPGITLVTNGGNGHWVIKADQNALCGSFIVYAKTGGSAHMLEITIDGAGMYIIGEGGGWSGSVNNIKVGPFNGTPEPTGALTVIKQLAGDAADGTFTIILYDAEGVEIDRKPVTTVDGIGTVIFDELIYGAYRVFELDSDSDDFPYEVYIPGDGWLTVDGDFMLYVVNTLKEQPIQVGSLTVIKQLVGDAADGTFTIILYDAEGVEIDRKPVTTVDGIGTVIFEELIHGVYRVSELDSDSDDFPYEVYIPGDGWLTVNDDCDVYVLNTLKEQPIQAGSLTVIKELVGDAADDTFTIILYDAEGVEIDRKPVTTVDGVGTVTFEELQYGEYVIDEQTDDPFPYTVSIADDGHITLDGDIQVTVYNIVEAELPSVRLSITKHVLDANDEWADAASYTAESIEAQFKIKVSLDVSELLAYNEEHNKNEVTFVGGTIQDLLDGNPVPLNEDGSFRLFYVNENEKLLSQTFYVQTQVTLGSHENVAIITEPWSDDILGEPVIERESDSAAISLTAPEPTTEPTQEPTSTPEPTTEPTPEPTTEPTPEPTTEPTPEPTTEPTPGPNPGPNPGPGPEPEPGPVDIVDEEIPLDDLPEPEPEPVDIIDEEIPLDDVPEPPPEPEPEPEPDPVPEPDPIIEDEPVPLGDLPKTGEGILFTIWALGLGLSLSLTAAILLYLRMNKHERESE